MKISLNRIGQILFIAILPFASTISFAQPKADYYTSALDGKSGKDLELALKNIIYPHTKIRYDHLWEAYEITDPGPKDSIPSGNNGKTDLVYDMYAWMSQYPKFYSDKDHSQTGGFNREHAVPNSWWGGESGNDIAYTDLHHLVPGDGAANNAKQNYPLGEYKSGMTLSWPTETKANTSGVRYMAKDTHDHSQMPCYANASHVWKVSTSEYGGANYVFEPADQYKGDFARMYLYVVCAYEGIVWKANEMFETVNGHTNIKTWALNLLLDWHKADPVSDKERKRNNAVESIQGNRNPFIDYPELVDYIWGDKKSEAFSLAQATSSYDSKYSTRPSAEWQLNNVKVASVEAEYDKPFTSPTLVVTPSGEYTISFTSSDESVATVDGNGIVTFVSTGSTTITATVKPTNPSVPEAVASYILTIVKPKDAACYLLETFDGNTGKGGNDNEWSGNIAQGSIKSDYSDWSFTKGFGAKRCIKIGTADEAGVATTPEISFTGDAIISFKAGAWNVNSEVTTINISATNGTLSQTSVELEKGAWTDYRIYITGVNGSTQITFTASATDGKNNRFFLDEVSVTSGYVRSVNTANIGTICLPRAFEKPSTMTLYNIIGKDETKIYFEENAEDIAAGRPYLFRSTEETITLTYTGEKTTKAGISNGLVGTFDGCTIIPNIGNYILSNNTLYVVDSEFNCGANRAYIHIDGINNVTAAKADFTLDFNDPTGITSYDNDNENDNENLYNLNGMRVNKAYKGIIVTKDKKYMNK